MMTLNLKINFIYGWYSLRTIKIFTDGVLYDKILAQGEHIIDIPENTKEITFKFGTVFKYSTTILVTDDDRLCNEIFIGLHLHYRSLLLSYYDSLKSDYLRGVKLNQQGYSIFQQNQYNKDYIVLKDYKIAILSLAISVLILLFSIVQQENELSPIAFLIGLCSTITFLVYFRERKVEKITFKTRMLSTIVGFLFALFFLENSFLFLHWIIILFSGLLFMLYFENIKQSTYI